MPRAPNKENHSDKGPYVPRAQNKSHHKNKKEEKESLEMETKRRERRYIDAPRTTPIIDHKKERKKIRERKKV